MPVYNPLVPTGTVNLDVDYQNLQGNFEQANIVYGTNHYPLNNATPNQGFHNFVTTPAVVNSPPDGLPPATSATTLQFYAYQQYAALGLLHYSRGINNAVPTPLTNLNSGAAAVVIPDTMTTNILDFTGMSVVFCELFAAATIAPANNKALATILWTTGGVALINLNPGLNILAPQFAGNTLQLKNNSGGPLSVFWSLKVQRAQ